MADHDPQADTAAVAANLGSLGVEAPVRTTSTLYEDWLPQLRGARAAKVWQQMSDNDATVGSLLFTIEMLLRAVTWDIEDPPDGNTAKTELVAGSVAGMRRPWADIIADTTTMLPYGWYAAEQTFREQAGQVVWDDFAYRPQTSVIDWHTDEQGRPTAMIQEVGNGRTVPIPAAKLLLFRTVNRGHPTGRSILRNAYRAWKLKTRAEDWAAIGAERHAGGIPKAMIPADDILTRGAFFDEAKKIVTRIKRDEQAGIVWPSDRDESGNLMYEFDLVRSEGGDGLRFVVELARMFSVDILSTVLAGFIALGRDAVGSRALAEPQQELFQTALEGWADQITGTLNRQAIPTLMRLNGLEPPYPTFTHSPVKDVDLEGLSQFILRTAQAGADWQMDDDDATMSRVRQLAGFPAATNGNAPR